MPAAAAVSRFFAAGFAKRDSKLKLFSTTACCRVGEQVCEEHLKTPYVVKDGQQVQPQGVCAMEQGRPRAEQGFWARCP